MSILSIVSIVSIVLGIIVVFGGLFFFLFIYALVSVSKFDDEEVMRKITNRGDKNGEVIL
ncbi:MAG: hypothetical protein IJV31_00535 [Clostridia bacterium]|nr:hypothetical protein [Clostridia bacterium]